MNKTRKQQGGPRSAARLAVVQALYQLEASAEPNLKPTVKEFITHRLGAEVDGEQYVEADAELFSDVAEGAWNRRDEWDAIIAPCLTKEWSLDRIEPIVHAIFRAGAYELTARPDVPTPVIINEYLDVAHAFYERTESAFVNGVLDKMAKTIR